MGSFAVQLGQRGGDGTNFTSFAGSAPTWKAVRTNLESSEKRVGDSEEAVKDSGL